MPALLVVNAGSSSLKCAVYGETGEEPIASILADRIGPQGELVFADAHGHGLCRLEGIGTHEDALEAIVDQIRDRWPGLNVAAVGHRVVHGGALFAAPVLVDDTVLEQLDALSPFAPLHQPHNLAGIRAALRYFPGVPQLACFDTAFHRGHAFAHDAFALPRALYEDGVRRYGFHGLSYDYIASELQHRFPSLHQGRVIVAHLGNGASMCGMIGGRSVVSTMGFSALDGLPMGTRCGQIDPGVLLYLMDQKGMSSAAIADLLYRQSGLLGLSGLSNDMRSLEASTETSAGEAIAYFVTSCRREIGSLTAAMGGLDALVFTGGIGEHSRLVRAQICKTMTWLGLKLDETSNAEHAVTISSRESRVPILVIPTSEERVILRSLRGLALVSAGGRLETVVQSPISPAKV